MKLGQGLVVGGGALLALVVLVGLLRSCGWTEPVTFPDYSDSLAAARQQFAADSATWQAERRALAVSRDSLFANSEYGGGAAPGAAE